MIRHFKSSKPIERVQVDFFSIWFSFCIQNKFVDNYGSFHQIEIVEDY